jgi:hypothetical protein
LEGDVQFSTILGSRPDLYPGAWLIAKAAFALVAISLMTLTVAALEMRLGIAPTDDDAAAWTLSDE